MVLKGNKRDLDDGTFLYVFFLYNFRNVKLPLGGR